MGYYDSVRHLLNQRISGFDVIFDALKAIENPIIVETGCARLENNFSGDGQSSLLYDHFIDEHGGEFYTVDNNQTSYEYCVGKMISKNSHVILDDSVNYLHNLNKEFLQKNKKIDFLYLDSFDCPLDNPELSLQSGLHHMYELTAIIASLKEGSIVGIDDSFYNNEGVPAGKSRFIFEFMTKIGKKPIFKGYQLLYRI